MAVDATGTPSPLGIPKYNTGADAPSGKGLNAIVDALDTLITARVTKPSGGVNGDVPVWDGSAWRWPTGTRDGTKFLRDDGSWQSPVTSDELSYQQVTSDVNVTGTTSGTANTVVTADAINFDGSTAVLIEFFSYGVQPVNVVGGQLIIGLFEGSTLVSTVALVQGVSTNPMIVPAHIVQRLTPSSGSKTYSIRAWTGSGTSIVKAGTGSGGAAAPAFVRISRAA